MTETNNFVLFFWCQKSPWGVRGVYSTVQRCRDIWGERALWGDGQKDVGEGQSELSACSLVQHSRTKTTSELVCMCMCVCVFVCMCVCMCMCALYNYVVATTTTTTTGLVIVGAVCDPTQSMALWMTWLCWVSELDTSSSSSSSYS